MIGLGGMLGSLLRAWIGTDYTGLFPVPTILVNILGATALAVLHATQHRIHRHGRYLYMVGFCGSFTTVSLFSLESAVLAGGGDLLPALLNVLIPVVVSLVVVHQVVGRLDRKPGGSAK